MMRTDITWRWRGERLVHATLDGQLDVIGVHRRLLGMCGVDFSVLDDGRHVSCEQKQRRSDLTFSSAGTNTSLWLQFLKESLTVGELQHLVDDSGFVLRDAHVLQDLDHHLAHNDTSMWWLSWCSHEPRQKYNLNRQQNHIHCKKKTLQQTKWFT